MQIILNHNLHTATLLILSSLLLVAQRVSNAQRVDDELEYYAPDISVAEVVEARGYTAEVHHFVTTDHYQLELTRASNPLARAARRLKKLPLLLVHGIMQGGLTFVWNSRHVRPRLYEIDDQELASMDLEKLAELVKDDPARRSLVFMALNFGFEAWILERRGYVPGSRRKLGRPKRTVADALLEVPSTLLAGGFSLTGGLETAGGRPVRQPIDFLNYTSINSSQLNGVQSPTLSDMLGLPGQNFWQALQTIAKLPQSIGGFGDKRQQFIDTFDTDFWAYSNDEQAQYDLPESIDYVLRQTNTSKVHLVGYSCGGAISMLALTAKPELANKISRAVMWAPAVNLGAPKDSDYGMSFAVIPAQAYIGPMPFLFQEYELKTAEQQACNTPFVQRAICEPILDRQYGSSNGQEPPSQAFFAVTPTPTASREIFQLAQFAHTKRPCKFRFNTRAMNIEKYGGDGEPPCYDFSRILLSNMSFYAGITDTQVAPDDVATTVAQMRVPYELNLIGDEEIHFNHVGNELHIHNDRLIILPSLLDIARSQAQEPA